MLIENISIVLSVFCLALSLINVVLMIVRERHRHQIKIKFNEIELKFSSKEAAIQQLLEIIEISDLSAEGYLKILHDKINEIYPDSNTRISIKMIKNKDLKHPENSKVVTWICYPKKEDIHTNLPLYTIKNNTDLNSIYVNNSEYFWVSNLREFDMFSIYKNENGNFMKKWNTSIVYPIKKEHTDTNQSTVIGFLSISSIQEFNNVKKNELVIECIKKVANKLYNVLQKEDSIYEITSDNE